MSIRTRLHILLARDSLFWTLGLLAAIGAAFIAIGSELHSYGVPVTAEPYVRGVSVIIVAIFAYAKSSPFRSQNEIRNGGDNA